MNNLKRVLSLALSGIMLVGMMAMGASAADFTDDEDIVHSEAVNVLVALSVINGQDDGSFNPEGNVTRAQMAKMIAVAMNGGADANTGVKGTASFTDIKGHWAESYIEYCYDLGIISGRGDGTFDPDGDVTGLEATKMVLTALGYESQAYLLTGAAWAVRTDELARKASPSLYYELDGVIMANKSSRDTAAQLIWNGLRNKSRKVTPSTNTSNGEVTWQYNEGGVMLTERYGAKIDTGIFTGNDKNNTSAEAGQIVVEDENGTEYYVPSDLDISYIGEEVQVIYKTGKNSLVSGPDKNDKIYGVFVTGETQVVRSIIGKVANNKANEAKIKVDGTKYSLADSVEVIYNYGTASATFTGGALKGSSAGSGINSALTKELIETDKVNGNTIKMLLTDSKVTTIYVTESKIAKVTAVSSEKVTLSGSFGTVKIADNDIYDGVKKNDVVVVSRLFDNDPDDGYTIVKKAEVVSGTVSAFKDEESVTVDGTTYKTYNKTLDTSVKDLAIDKFANKHIGEDFDLYMVNGYVGAAVQTSESYSNYSLVVDVSTTGNVGSVLNGVKIQVLGADGTKTILTLNDDSVNKTAPANSDGTYPALTRADLDKGHIVTYSVDKNGEATVELVAKKDPANAEASYVSKTKAFDGKTIASEAVFFVNTATDAAPSYKAYDMRSLNNFTIAANAGLTVVEDDDEIVAVYGLLGHKPSGATSTTVYGIVSAYSGSVKVNGDAYKSYVVDVNDEQYTVYSNVSGLAKGKLVELELTSDDIYSASELKILGTTLAVEAKWVSKYSDRDNTITVADAVYKNTNDTYVVGVSANNPTTTKVYAIDSDTKIYYVDQDNDKGVLSSISEFSTFTGKKNVIVIDDDNDNVADVVIFEVSNETDIL